MAAKHGFLPASKPEHVGTLKRSSGSNVEATDGRILLLAFVSHLLLEEAFKVERPTSGLCVTGEVRVEVGRKVSLHVPEDVVLELLEEVVEVEVKVLCFGAAAAEEGRPASVVLLPFGVVRQDFVSWNAKCCVSNFAAIRALWQGSKRAWKMWPVGRQSCLNASAIQRAFGTMSWSRVLIKKYWAVSNGGNKNLSTFRQF